ncbi:hypothetical protein SteCoe_20307 [Stentor coeruleus]|uniref:EF-hand domain-containing protein n=1 Tax=Stentor coeruleus TaxID=5963 RepID=A0A1R2BS24_9CILI|nr:hypothetical protein SteCoe_20307 [Stentor coeruleus]
MSNLFETNRSSIKKLFSIHEKEGILKFTDLLKLCSSTRIFPDLLSSPDLHKVLIEVAQDPTTCSISQNLTYLQFEIFLHSVAAKAFPFKPDIEQDSLLFMHLKNSCSLKYSLDFEVTNTDKKLEVKKVPRLNIDSAKLQRQTPKSSRTTHVKPSSTKNIKSSSFLFRNSPRKESIEKRHKAHACSIISSRTKFQKSSTKVSPRPTLTERNPKRSAKTISFISSPTTNITQAKINKILGILSIFKNKTTQGYLEKSIRCRKFINFLSFMEKKISVQRLQIKLALKLWFVITKKTKRNNFVY